MRKNPDQITRQIANRLDDTWVAVVLSELNPRIGAVSSSGEGNNAAGATVTPWPHTFPLGRASSAELAGSIGAHIRALHEWRTWATAHDVHLEEVPRTIHGTPQLAAKHVVIDDIDRAATIAGSPWPSLLTLARTRSAHLAAEFPAARPGLAKLLRPVTKLDDIDFEILCRTADWFRRTPELQRIGLTPRQVPIEGVHATWLNTHQTLVRTLAGLDDLNLLPPHPPRAHFTYLDPDHLASGGRRHDSISVGDNVALPYTPAVVLISENKDTSIGFPPVAGGIAIEGAGTGGGTIASIDWVHDAALVVYWGDIDADGLEILNEFRERGIAATSIFMDSAAYQTYNRYGTNHDRHGEPLRPHLPGQLPNLHSHEQALYDHLTSGIAPVLRIEQERIPLDRADAQLARLRGRHEDANALGETGPG
jgi:hypothetical protein